MNRKIVSGIVSLAAIGAMSASAFATTILKPVTVTGQLLDLNCYSAAGAMGRAHGKVCGKNCLLSGAPAGILVHGHAWTLDANPKPLAPYVGLTIKVKGKENARDNVLLPMIVQVKLHGHWKAIRLIPLYMPVGK